MKNKVLINLPLLLLFIALPIAFYGQGTQATVDLDKSGTFVSFRTEMKDAEDSVLDVSFDTYVYVQKPNVIHRVLGDEKSGLFFGYDFEYERVSNQDFKVSIKPLSIKANERFNINRRFTNSNLPKYPESLTLKEGETLVLSLLENPQTKVKIIDSIKISKRTPTNRSSVTTAVGSNSSATKPRDFSPEAIGLKLNNAQLFLNNKKVLEAAKTNYFARDDDFLYLYIPGKGRFIFSLTPLRNYDFKKIGVVENNRISFTFENETYQIISQSSVFELSGKWNLWVLHDSNYQTSLSATENYRIGVTKLNDKN